MGPIVHVRGFGCSKDEFDAGLTGARVACTRDGRGPSRKPRNLEIHHADAAIFVQIITSLSRVASSRTTFSCFVQYLPPSGRAARQTLLAFGRNNLGGTIGLTFVLHTWDQQLRPHVHAVVTGGALADDGSRWIDAGAKFLFPVKALSKVFRGKYVEGVEKLLAENALDLPPQLVDARQQRQLLRKLRRKPWVVYSKRPFAGPAKLLDYLGRYTHRVAISNHRLVSLEEGQVTFTYRDRRDGDRRKTMRLPAEEFIGRFLKHVLPKGFMRIRHYGLLANRAKQQRLAACRALLDAEAPAPAERKTWAEWLLAWTGEDPARCPVCGRFELVSEELRRPPRARRGALDDAFW